MPMITLSGGPYHGQEVTVNQVKAQGDIVSLAKNDDESTGSRYEVNADTSTATYIDDKTVQDSSPA